MKKILFLLSISIVLFSSCEGDQGPPGPQGEPGLIGEAFERTISFNAANEFLERIPLNPNIAPNDVILVYRLEDVIDNLKVWEPLPTVTLFLNDAADTSVQYRFNFTVGDIDIIMESNNLDLVPANLTENQVFRIVIVPAEVASSSNINFNDFNAVQSALQLEFN
ncbi:hypothetical protein [Aquimarina mytili]|uniref:Collagen-like protein n=1 Tax=Aquimarina mytili TaxID=874423 RepID=A0A936ZUX7_9FLAO|nr:hypothetical protein [Aquimarina mytili]MBL0685847.1 hypothetical protein [Aquimarina mytili]